MSNIRPELTPTPEEIEAECRRIRETWTELDYYQHAPHLAPKPVAIPEQQRVAIRSGER